MYKLVVKEGEKLGILELNDKAIYSGIIIKDSRKGDIIRKEDVDKHNKSLLPWYKRIFS